ncbi:MAG: PqqD family peptide modification chaperone [Anaerolineales bacterium]|nr:MAG: PqqD family peptide modification chaperone [Anaerolineales bacterium]
MSTLNPPIPNPIVVLREEFDDWAILFNPDTAAAVGINPVGVAVWKLLDGVLMVEQIVAQIGEQFEGVPESVPDELMTFITELEEGGFVGYEVEIPSS